MELNDYTMNTSYQLGTYKAIAEMMKDAVRKLEAAEADSFEEEYMRMRLSSLATQFEETKEKFFDEQKSY